MKRATDSRQDEVHSHKALKRYKANQACASCRKSKTRCEILGVIEESKTLQCHRCQVLGIGCSYADMDRSMFRAYVVPGQPESPASQGESPPTTVPSDTESTRSSRPPPVVSEDPYLRDVNNGQPAIKPDGFFNWVRNPHPLDWVRTPMDAIQEVIKEPLPCTAIPPITVDHSLQNILSDPQIENLVNIFMTQYMPWLNFTLHKIRNSSLLELACCTIAARHLDPASRSQTMPRLQKLTEDAVARVLFNTRNEESIPVIQSLIILSLWTPVGGIDNGRRDNKLLIASALSIAMNERLHEASQQVLTLPPESEELPVMMERARLWAALANVESMLSFGTRRTPLSRRTPSDINFITVSPTDPSSQEVCFDIRLKLLGELFQTAEYGYSLNLTTMAGLDRWYDALLHTCEDLEGLHRLLTPLKSISNYDQFYFHIQNVIHASCKLIILLRSVSNARKVYINDYEETWFVQVKPHGGPPVISGWAREIEHLSETVLLQFIEADRRLLHTCPDIVFAFVTFSAMIIVSSKFLVMRNFGIGLLGSADQLLQQTAKIMQQVAVCPDHVASRYSYVVNSITDCFEKKLEFDSDDPYQRAKAALEALSRSEDSQEGLYPDQHQVFTDSDIGPMPNLQYTTGAHQYSQPYSMLPGAAQPMDPDTEFWSLFMGSGAIQQSFDFSSPRSF